MDRIEISSPYINLSEIVKHVSRNRVSVELSEDQIPLARIVPIDSTRSMVDLDRALRESTRLGDDAEAYALDVLSVRQDIGELDDPWESFPRFVLPLLPCPFRVFLGLPFPNLMSSSVGRVRGEYSTIGGLDIFFSGFDFQSATEEHRNHTEFARR